MVLDSCKFRGQTVDFGINIYVHVLFLFIILSMLFIHIISKIESDAINNELSDLVSDGIQNNYTNLDNSNKEKIKSVLDMVDLNTLSKLYDRDDKTRKINNNNVFKSIHMSLAVLAIIFILVIVLNKALCHNVPLKHIIIENLIIFTGIGIVEFMFFKYIILKYVPTKPSFMLEYIVDRAKNIVN
jgi:hypothetical protein